MYSLEEPEKGDQAAASGCPEAYLLLTHPGSAAAVLHLSLWGSDSPHGCNERLVGSQNQ